MADLIADISEILQRDLRELATEVALTPDDHLWKTLPGVINPVGTIALHLCGNLRHFIGAILNSDGYVRDIDQEFGVRDLDKTAVLQEIELTIAAVAAALEHLPSSRLSEVMAQTPPHHTGRSVGFFLIQLCVHFSRHRGQLNYLRRMLEGDTTKLL